MNKTPSKQELASIKRFAHGAFGYAFSDGRVLDLWRLANGLPVIAEWPGKQIMRRIARCWLCCCENAHAK